MVQCFICCKVTEAENIDMVSYDDVAIFVCLECDSRIRTNIQDSVFRAEQFERETARKEEFIKLLKEKRAKQKVSNALLHRRNAEEKLDEMIKDMKLD